MVCSRSFSLRNPRKPLYDLLPFPQDYNKNLVPSQFIAERGADLVVINPGSENVRIGLAPQPTPFNVPHCIARRIKGSKGETKFTVKDALLNSLVMPSQQLDREKAYDDIASLLKIPFLDEEAANVHPNMMGRVEGYNPQFSKADATFAWTDVMEKKPSSFSVSEKHVETESVDQSAMVDDIPAGTYREFICGEEALRISSGEPYCLSHPIRRGHFNVSLHYSVNQVIEDLHATWDWILCEKMSILPADRSSYSVVLVVPESFDSREIKEMVSIVLRDLKFNSVVVHQEGLAAAFGNGLSTACIVNIGAQVTSVICIEDGVALPSTTITLPFGGYDISRCLLWIQENHHTWPNINTDPIRKPVDLLMLNKIKESYCQIREGEFDVVAIINSYEEGMPVGSHKSRLAALNVPPMGLFYPMLLVPEEYPAPPLPWFHDHEDMFDDTWRPDNSDSMFFGASGLNSWDNYPVFPTRQKREAKSGIADAICNSILSTGRIDLQRKLFCSIHLVGGVAFTSGLIPATEERVLQAIPLNEAVDTVEVLQPRNDPLYVSWNGGVIIGILDFGRDLWIHREDWLKNGIHVGDNSKYRESYFVQALPFAFISS